VSAAATAQPGILAPGPAAGHFLTVRMTSPQQGKPLLRALAAVVVDDRVVVGVGFHFVTAIGASLPGLRAFPAMTLPESAGGAAVPTTQADVWLYVRGDAPGEVFAQVHALFRTFPGGLVLVDDVATFCFQGGRDLSGYEDGTENPKGAAANEAALVPDGPLAGTSFVAVQRWEHDLGAFAAMPRKEQDAAIGRERDTNAELADAPPSAHVKRSAQESFEPAAFMLRRSMPYGRVGSHGLYFVAFGADLDRFERVMRRMAGLDDGVVDALFRFSRPLTGGYYWCPAVHEGKLDLRPILPAGVDALPDIEVG